MGPSTSPQLDPIDLSKSKFKTSTFGDPLRNWKKKKVIEQDKRGVGRNSDFR